MFERVITTVRWTAMIALLIVVVTGVLLSMYYVPSTAGDPLSDAAASVRFISSSVVGGPVVRAVHHHATSLLVASVLVWVGLMVWQWRDDRRRWWLGIGLAVIALVGAWTGRLLPDDAYAATSREVMRYALRESHGGDLLATLLSLKTLPTLALANAYAMHAIVLLIASGIVIAKLRRDSDAGPTRITLAAAICVGVVVMLVRTMPLGLPGDGSDVAPSRPWWMFLPIHHITDGLGAELTSILTWGLLTALVSAPWWIHRISARTRLLLVACATILFAGLLFA
jgi:quinol-cytochrome oxidoreductase complex cytochrome b subunit